MGNNCEDCGPSLEQRRLLNPNVTLMVFANCVYAFLFPEPPHLVQLYARPRLDQVRPQKVLFAFA